MSSQMLIGGTAAAMAAAAMYHQEKDHRTVSHIASDTTNHLRWNVTNIRDGVYDDVVSFKNAIVHMLTFGGSRRYDTRQGSLYRDGRTNAKSSWFGSDSTQDASRTGSSWIGGDSRSGRPVLERERANGSWFGGSDAKTLEHEHTNGSWFGRDQRTGTAGSNIRQGISETVDDIKDAGANLGHEAKGKVQRSIADAKQTVNDATKEASDKTQSLFNWGFNKAEKSKAIAIGEYDKANKDYERALGAYNNGRGHSDEHLKHSLEQAQHQLQECRDKLNAISSEFDHYAKQSIDDISRQLDVDDRENQRRGFFSWFCNQVGSDVSDSANPSRRDASWADSAGRYADDARNAAAHKTASWAESAENYAADVKNGAQNLASRKLGPAQSQDRLDVLDARSRSTLNGPSEEERLAANAAKALKGWGETAAELAQEELEDEKRRANRFWKN